MFGILIKDFVILIKVFEILIKELRDSNDVRHSDKEGGSAERRHDTQKDEAFPLQELNVRSAGVRSPYIPLPVTCVLINEYILIRENFRTLLCAMVCNG